jgi:hypothetical protein
MGKFRFHRLGDVLTGQSISAKCQDASGQEIFERKGCFVGDSWGIMLLQGGE